DLALPTLLVGGHTIMTRSGGFSIERAVDNLERFRVTDAVLYPTMIYELLALESLDGRDLGALERIVSGGSALRPDALALLHERLPGVECLVGYGSTEGGAIITMPTRETLAGHPQAAGRPLPFVELRIVDGAGVPVEADTEGEILVRSPAVA